MSNHIKKVAVVGATGSVGKYIVRELLKKGTQQVTAITRVESQATMPDGVAVAKVSYDDPASLADALKGHDALVISMSSTAQGNPQGKLIDAAAAAGVKYVLPNEWGIDTDVGTLGTDTLMGPGHVDARAQIERLGVSSWISVVTGYWYTHSLAIPDAFGMDWKNKTMTFYDDGKQKINMITWDKTGRAMAALLALPIEPEKPGEPNIAAFKNKKLYTTSWTLSQRDVFESVLRVSGTSEADWTIRTESSKERYEAAKERIFKHKDYSAFPRALYSRTFYPNDDGNFLTRHAADDAKIGLNEPEEDLDLATKEAIDVAAAGYRYGA